MENKEIVPGLENLLRDFLSAQVLELVELSCRHEGRNLVVRLLVDKPEGGITMGDCVTINRRIGDWIEEKEIIRDSYILEVDSPGLDRPLKVKQDFSRCLGRQVKFFLIAPINGTIEIEGLISQVEENGVNAQTAQGVCFIPFSQIQRAKQMI